VTIERPANSTQVRRSLPSYL